MLARTDALPRGRRAMRMFNRCIVTEIAGMSDLELYDWLELLS